MDLNWFMPAFVKSRVGSDRGTTGAEATVHQSVCGNEAENRQRRKQVSVRTISMAILLEIVQKSVSDPSRGPFRTGNSGSHGAKVGEGGGCAQEIRARGAERVVEGSRDKVPGARKKMSQSQRFPVPQKNSGNSHQRDRIGSPQDHRERIRRRRRRRRITADGAPPLFNPSGFEANRELVVVDGAASFSGISIVMWNKTPRGERSLRRTAAG